MTVKLLNAYEELDGQPIQGENIINSKKEIENTLDTLNKALEKCSTTCLKIRRGMFHRIYRCLRVFWLRKVLQMMDLPEVAAENN